MKIFIGISVHFLSTSAAWPLTPDLAPGLYLIKNATSLSIFIHLWHSKKQNFQISQPNNKRLIFKNLIMQTCNISHCFVWRVSKSWHTGKMAKFDDFFKIGYLRLGLHTLDFGYIVHDNSEKNYATPPFAVSLINDVSCTRSIYTYCTLRPVPSSSSACNSTRSMLCVS